MTEGHVRKSYRLFGNKSNIVGTIDTFSLVLVLIIVLLLLEVAQINILSCFRPLHILILVKNGT